MSMTRQNYEELAATLGRAVAVEAIDDDAKRAELCAGAAYRVALAVAVSLVDTSPRFNRVRFMAAVRKHAERTRCELGGLQAITARVALQAAGVA